MRLLAGVPAEGIAQSFGWIEGEDMSTHTVIRPADEGMPTPSAPGSTRTILTCGTCLWSFAVWGWADAAVTVEHIGNGDTHRVRHDRRGSDVT